MREASSQCGSALLVVVFTVMAVMSLSVAVLMLGTARTETAFAVSRSELSFQAAETGLALMIRDMHSLEDSGGDGLERAVGAIGAGAYEVTTAPPFDGSPGDYTIVSVGTFEGYTRRVEIDVSVALNNDFPYGFFGANEVRASGSVFFDSYDSRNGTYDSQAVNSHPVTYATFASDTTRVGSNGSIHLSDSVEVLGSVTPGPSGSVNTSGSVYIEQTETPSTEDFVLEAEPYDPPALTAETLALDSSDTRTFGAGAHRFNSISMDSSSKVYIDGAVTFWVDGDMTILSSAEIVLLPGATLEMHFGSGIVDLGGSGIVNQSQNPADLELIHHGAAGINMWGSSNFHGRVYSPIGGITASGSAEYFGSLLGESIVLQDSVKFHYDDGLSSGSTNAEVTVVSWYDPKGEG